MRLRLRFATFRHWLGSVRVRLTLWYLAILALIFLVFGAILSGVAVHQAQVANQETLHSISQQLASTLGADGTLHVDAAFGDYPYFSGKQTIENLTGKGYPLGPFDIAVYFSVSDATQQFGPIAADGVARLRTLVALRSGDQSSYAQMNLPVSLGKSAATDMTYSLAFTDIQRQGTSVGTLVVGRQVDYTSTFDTLVPGLIVAGPITLLIAALGGYWLASRAMRPVRLITRTAREIGETDLSRRLHLKRHDEMGELASTFDRMLARLEAAFDRQRQFTADASHELRTPLTVVNLEVNRALAQRRSPEEYERALQVVQAENDYMSRLVANLLTLARADAGEAALRFERVDLGDVALEVVERLAPLAREHDITLAVGELPELTVAGDRMYLTHMLSNLVENAIKYTAGTGTRVGVATCAATRDGSAWACVRVEDDGPGIAPEHLPHLFERFYRVDTARSQSGDDDTPDGSGLGLAIAQWVAHSHGGDVQVRSDVGSGTTFEVWLPLSPPLHAGTGTGSAD
ncbi:MAG: Two-component system sensor histidine kinase [Ktedonobacterales bacterium]|jgi:heavy metal sensor kinase|nr:MAG: Two-component system sensor histidine kinase [Ktedonobacterales bacterium]